MPQDIARKLAGRRPRPRTAALLPCAGPRRRDGAIRALAFDASPTATAVLDEQLRTVAANAAYVRLAGRLDGAVLGTVPSVRGLDGTAVLELLRHDHSSPHPGCEAMIERHDGSARKVWMSWTRMQGSSGDGGLHVASFCELRRQDDEIRHWQYRAQHDVLTGLPNREHLGAEIERGLARAARHGHRLALLFIDLDRFKSVNDRLGHASGDDLLVQVGGRLREALRREDFVARHGGDEFVALLEAPREPADAATAAHGILCTLGRPLVLPGGSLPAVTASIGIALYPDHASDAEALLQAADAAMYRAKRAGGKAVAIGASAAVPGGSLESLPGDRWLPGGDAPQPGS